MFSFDPLVLIYFLFNTNFGSRAFALSAPTLWNMLLSSVESVEHIAKCRCLLKAYIYSLA